MLDAKVATMARCSILLNSSFNEPPTLLSEIVKPSTKALVESANTAKTPSLPNFASLSYSAAGPTGVRSILKSPV